MDIFLNIGFVLFATVTWGGSAYVMAGMVRENYQQRKARNERRKLVQNIHKGLDLEILQDGDRVLLVTKDARVWNRGSISEATDILSEVFEQTNIKFLMIDGTDWNVTVLREKQ